MRFPTVNGTSLDGGEFTLPPDCAGTANLVLVAFSEDQQPIVDTWLEPTAALTAAHPGFVVYEAFVVQRTIDAMHRIIDGRLHAAAANRTGDAHTVSVFCEKPALMRSLNMRSDDTVYALLLDSGGDVTWRASGPADEDAITVLRQEIDRLFGRRTPV